MGAVRGGREQGRGDGSGEERRCGWGGRIDAPFGKPLVDQSPGGGGGGTQKRRLRRRQQRRHKQTREVRGIGRESARVAPPPHSRRRQQCDAHSLCGARTAPTAPMARSPGREGCCGEVISLPAASVSPKYPVWRASGCQHVEPQARAKPRARPWAPPQTSWESSQNPCRTLPELVLS